MSAKTSFKDGNILNATDLNGLGEAINQNEHNLISVKSRLSTVENEMKNYTSTKSWNDIVEKPVTFPPTNHIHNISEINNLQDELDEKAEENHSHVINDITNLQNTLNSKFNVSGGTMNGSLKFGDIDGRGINFWNSDIYSIYMASADNTTYGGRLWESTSDYNMYFKMQNGTNRGFMFKNGSTVLGGFDGSGVFRALKMISTKDIYFGSGTTTDIGYITNGELTFANSKGIYGKDTNGTAQRMAMIGSDNYFYLGGGNIRTIIKSVDNPQTSIGTNLYNLWHEGNFNPNTYTPKELKQSITSWSSSENSQWAKIADINVEVANGVSCISFIVHGIGSNSSNYFAIIVANIKQANAMGTVPTATLYMPLTKNLSTTNVIGVITSNTTTKTTMSIYIKIPTSWSAFTCVKLTSFGTVNMYEKQDLITSLPSGTQVSVS